ncbi:MAG: hypothetical protein AAF204_02100 [Pseudomonadota bacterium]
MSNTEEFTQAADLSKLSNEDLAQAILENSKGLSPLMKESAEKAVAALVENNDREKLESLYSDSTSLNERVSQVARQFEGLNLGGLG